jgi:hypothetical protein
MNLIKTMVARIEERLLETKDPCKLYKSEVTAETMAEAWVVKGAEYFGVDARDVRYVIVYVPSVGKYAICFDTSYIFGAKKAGGYVGFFEGYFCY